MDNELQTASAVIDALGGTGATARLTGCKIQAVSNWRRTGRLPSALFVLMDEALRQRGKSASISAWGMVGRNESDAHSGGAVVK